MLHRVQPRLQQGEVERLAAEQILDPVDPGPVLAGLDEGDPVAERVHDPLRAQAVEEVGADAVVRGRGVVDLDPRGREHLPGELDHGAVALGVVLVGQHGLLVGLAGLVGGDHAQQELGAVLLRARLEVLEGVHVRSSGSSRVSPAHHTTRGLSRARVSPAAACTGPPAGGGGGASSPCTSWRPCSGPPPSPGGRPRPGRPSCRRRTP